MRAMRINVIEFVKQYNEAIDADLTSVEAAKLFGIVPSSLIARVGQLRKRGINLPQFKDQRALVERRKAAAERRAARAERRKARGERKPTAKILPPRMPTPVVDIDALSEQVAEKVVARLRDSLRLQFSA